MDAAGLAALISPSWFQSVPDVTGPAHAGAATWTAEDTIDSTQAAVGSQADQSNLYDWIIQFNTASLGAITSVADTTSLLVGGGIEFEVIRGLGLAGQVLVRSSGASLGAVENWLARDVNVATFEEDAVREFQMVPDDPQLNQLWGMTKIDAQDAWNISTGSKSVVVAVIDTGVDYNDADLAANIWTNPGEVAGNGADDDGNGFVDDVHGYNFADNNGNPMDDNGHGTHVAGTIAAVGDNGLGVAGVDWSVSIMPLKFLNSDGTGYLSDAIRAVNYATMERTCYGVNVRVMNNSWGGGDFSAAMQSAIQAANDASILFVAAAGNSGANNDVSPEYPANYTPPNVISVAASDQNDHLASFSNYGATTVDIAAPGVSIYSTLPGNKYAMYSGTSMAAPFVSGVAALAWSVDPNASVAEVRNAILQGADPVPALSGKVATGGRLDAYNTLRLIEAEMPQGPVIASLAASSSSVTAGAAVTFAAHGITDASGTVKGIYLYVDANNNGQYDSTDPLVGSTTAIVGGGASICVSTSSLAPGNYRYFARAQDANGRWSPAVSVTLTVRAADDHGHNAATATAIAAPSSTSGSIGVKGDVDWFKFQAVAGKTYTFTTQLGTLRDSTLSLYDAGGTTRLAFNDDYGSTPASQITWKAPASGTYCLAVAAYANSYTGSYVINVQTANSPPVLAAIGDQVMPSSQGTLRMTVAGSDPDGDPLRYSAKILTPVDPVAARAYVLDRQLGLYQPGGGYSTNLRGLNEKYLSGSGNVVYYILPSGALYRWGGSIAASTLSGTLSPAYYANPSLLWNAQPPALVPYMGSSVTASTAGNALTINRLASYTSDFYVQVTVSDGASSAVQTFRVSATAVASLRSAASSVPLLPLAGDSFEMPNASASAPMRSSIGDLAWTLWQSQSLPTNSPSSVFDTLAATSALTGEPTSLRDELFSRLDPQTKSSVDADSSLTAWDYDPGYLLAGRLTETWLTRVGSGSLNAKPSDTADERSAVGDETLFADLGVWRSAEHRAIDELFDLLADL